MKYLLLAVYALGMTSLAMADPDLCAGNGATHTASESSRIIQRAAREAGIEYSSTGVDTCNASSVTIASEGDGAGHVQIEERWVCGALFTFKDAKDETRFAQWLLDQYPDLAQKACVAIDVASPHPGVSGSNEKQL